MGSQERKGFGRTETSGKEGREEKLLHEELPSVTKAGGFQNAPLAGELTACRGEVGPPHCAALP